MPALGSEAIGAADRCRSLGRTLKVDGRFAEAQVAWRQALDILTRQTVLYPDAADLQRSLVRLRQRSGVASTQPP